MPCVSSSATATSTAWSARPGAESITVAEPGATSSSWTPLTVKLWGTFQSAAVNVAVPAFTAAIAGALDAALTTVVAAGGALSETANEVAEPSFTPSVLTATISGVALGTGASVVVCDGASVGAGATPGGDSTGAMSRENTLTVRPPRVTTRTTTIMPG